MTRTKHTVWIAGALAAAAIVAHGRSADALLGSIGSWVGSQVSKVGNFASNTFSTVSKSVSNVAGKAWNTVSNSVVGKGLRFAGGMVVDMGKELVEGAVQLGKGAYQLGTAGVRGVQGGVAYVRGDREAAKRYFSDSWKNLKAGTVNTLVGAWKVASNVPLPSAGALNVLGKLGKVGRIAIKGWQGAARARKLTMGLQNRLVGKGASFLRRLPGVNKGLGWAEGKATRAIGTGGAWLQKRAGSLFGRSGRFGGRVNRWIGQGTKQLQAKARKSIRGLPRTLSAKAVSYGMNRLGFKMPPRRRSAPRRSGGARRTGSGRRR
jgi:hypothetical protein